VPFMHHERRGRATCFGELWTFSRLPRERARRLPYYFFCYHKNFIIRCVFELVSYRLTLSANFLPEQYHYTQPYYARRRLPLIDGY
jgi:hypothetical protein